MSNYANAFKSKYGRFYHVGQAKRTSLHAERTQKPKKTGIAPAFKKFHLRVNGIVHRGTLPGWLLDLF